MSIDKNWGATPEEWLMFELMLGLGEDLLPVVSNLDAKISPLSKMKKLGKTPSYYNRSHQATGIPRWVESVATPAQLKKWSENPDYGISLIARTKHAIDLDILSDVDARRALALIDAFTIKRCGVVLPRRYRANSPKILLAFGLSDASDEFLKRVIKCEHGIIEFLGNRQQFIVAGTHESGVRYEWDRMEGGIPDIPVAIFEELFDLLQKKFGIGDPLVGKKRREPITIDAEEPVLAALVESGMVLSAELDGRVHITCPFEHEHTAESAESATTYWPAHTGGYAHASIKCLHAHCEGRRFDEYAEALGISPADDFDDITDEPNVMPGAKLIVPDPNRFARYPAVEYAKQPTSDDWLCRDILPRARLGIMYGESGSGKTFIIWDLICAIAQGKEWNGHKTKKSKVLYVCAEGQTAFRNRITAYCQKNGIDELDVEVMDGGPDLMSKRDIKALIESLQGAGFDLIVVDTYATCMSGDENSGKDTGLAITHCKLIHQMTGAMVVLVHHSPKSGGGARGHSSLRAACDVELEILRDEDRRMLNVTKQKDGGDDLAIGFRLIEIGIREREDGSSVTSCVVEYTNLMVSKKRRGGKEALGTCEAAVFEVIQNLYEETEFWPDRTYVIQELKNTMGIRPDNVTRAIENLIDKERVVDTKGILSIN